MIEGLDRNTKVRRVAAHLAAEVQGESVILHATEGVYYGLNTTGTRLWELVKTETDVDNLLATLTAEFAVADEALYRDVLGVLGEMIEAGLVEVVASSS